MATDGRGDNRTHLSRTALFVRAFVVFVAIMVGLGGIGWIAWTSHEATLKNEHLAHDLKDVQTALAVTQRTAASSLCSGLSTTNANVRAAVHDLTGPLPVTPTLDEQTRLLRMQSNAQKLAIRNVFAHRFPSLHYDGHHCRKEPTTP